MSPAKQATATMRGRPIASFANWFERRSKTCKVPGRSFLCQLLAQCANQRVFNGDKTIFEFGN